jgi:penicillin amidase
MRSPRTSACSSGFAGTGPDAPASLRITVRRDRGDGPLKTTVRVAGPTMTAPVERALELGAGELLALIGDSGYALGARQKQIADTLMESAPLDEPALLALQLDDRALFLERWNRLLRDTVGPMSAAEWRDIAEAAEDDSPVMTDAEFRRQTLGVARKALGVAP